MAVNKYGPQVHKALKDNPLTPVYHSKCIVCGREYYHIFQFQDNCYPCIMGTNPLHSIHQRTKKHTKCRTFKEFIAKYGDQPSFKHRFLQDPKTKTYAWRIAPAKRRNKYEGITPIGNGNRYMVYYRNKYIGSYADKEIARISREAYIAGMATPYVHEIDLRNNPSSQVKLPDTPTKNNTDNTKPVFNQEKLTADIERDIDNIFGDIKL